MTSLLPHEVVGYLILVTLVFIVIVHIVLHFSTKPKDPKDKDENE